MNSTTTIDRPPESDPLVTDDQIAADALERQLASIQQRSEAFAQSLATGPQTQPCPVCGHEAKLDLDACYKGTTAKAVYTCEYCAETKAARELGERIERAGIPSDVRGATLDNFEIDRPNVKCGKEYPTHKTPTQFLAAAREFLIKGKRNLILAGTPGIGKGHIAAAIAIHFLKQGWRIAWIECAKLFRDYHRAYANDTNEAITDRLGTVRLLVIDEICLRDLPADGEEILFAILDRRHKDGLPTIFLGNKPADEIRAWLGGRITDRLRSGGVIFCYGEWESMRGRAADGAQNEF